jgi:hypothetical protein
LDSLHITLDWQFHNIWVHIWQDDWPVTQAAGAPIYFRGEPNLYEIVLNISDSYFRNVLSVESGSTADEIDIPMRIAVRNSELDLVTDSQN